MRHHSHPLRRAVAVMTSVVMLAGCTTQMGRIGADDGSDPCRRQLVALDSTGNYFAEDIITGAVIGAAGGAIIGGLLAVATGRGTRGALTGAAIGAGVGGVAGAATGYFAARQRQAQDQASLNAAIASDLAKENEELDRTQLAFNQLMDCRLAARAQIIADARSGRLPRPRAQAQLTDLRNKIQNDVAVAQRINGRIGTRGAEFDTAIENVAPGTRERAQAGKTPRNTTVAQPLVLRSRPDSAAPEVSRVSSQQRVTVTPAAGNFALVETQDGTRGYVPAAQVGTRGLGTQAAASGGDVRQLAASNISRRDSFNESIENAQRLAQNPSGFEAAT